MNNDETINFLIVDCEGNSSNRCRQIGIVSAEADSLTQSIYKEYINYKKQNPMQIFKTSYGDIVQKNIKLNSKERIVPVFTFGNYDEFLIIRKLQKDKGKFKDNLHNKFVFIDMQKVVTDYLKANNGIRIPKSKSLSLEKMANIVGTEVVHPCHDALADSQTLYRIILKYNEMSNGGLYKILTEAIKYGEIKHDIKIDNTKSNLVINTKQNIVDKQTI